MTSLIPIVSRVIAKAATKTVQARELHAFLEVGRDYSNWIKSRIEQYQFVEGEDYILIRQNGRIKTKGGDRRSTDHYLTLDMAKELAMVERNDKGRQARRYFIECEKQLTTRKATIPAPPEQMRFLVEIKGDQHLPVRLLHDDDFVANAKTLPDVISWVDIDSEDLVALGKTCFDVLRYRASGNYQTEP